MARPDVDRARVPRTPSPTPDSGKLYWMKGNRCQKLNPGGARFCNACGAPLHMAMPATAPRSYTPAHLAERILTSRSGIEGERKQITVLFADVKGSMELLADRDAEEAG